MEKYEKSQPPAAGWGPPPPGYGYALVPLPATGTAAQQLPAAEAAPSPAELPAPGLPPRPAVSPSAPSAPSAAGGLARWDARAYGALVDIAIGAGILTAYQMTLALVSPVVHVLLWVTSLFGGDFTSVVNGGTWGLALGWWGWQWVQRGITGQTLGQRLMGVMVVDQETRRPIGAGRSVVRSLTHVVDIAPVWLGFARPVWARDGQTWADRIHRTVALPVPPSFR
jgi:RDD family